MIEFKQILVPLDGSALSERALPLAMALARKFESQIILLRVVDIPHEVSLGWRIEAGQHAHQEAESYLKTQQSDLRENGFDVNILVHDGSPADAILEVATNQAVEVIIMSTHGRGGLVRWAIGSVADKVARHSPCPVLLVRQQPEDTKES